MHSATPEARVRAFARCALATQSCQPSRPNWIGAGRRSANSGITRCAGRPDDELLALGSKVVGGGVAQAKRDAVADRNMERRIFRRAEARAAIHHAGGGAGLGKAEASLL